MLGPGHLATAHHLQALHEHRLILGGQFVPIPLARIGHGAPPGHFGMVPSHCAFQWPRGIRASLWVVWNLTTPQGVGC